MITPSSFVPSREVFFKMLLKSGCNILSHSMVDYSVYSIML